MSGLCPAGSGIEVSTEGLANAIGAFGGTPKSLQSANLSPPTVAERALLANQNQWNLWYGGQRG